MPSEHAHTVQAIRERLARRAPQSYLRDWVYGGIDGTVTTFAVVSGVTGAALGSRVIVILGIANLIADGFSMAASNYAGTMSERHQLDRAAAIEQRHIDDDPEGERTEIREIFRRKGLDGHDLEAIVRRITANRRLWIKTMVAEEYGLALEVRSPWLAALSTFSAFVLCGLVPLLPFLLGGANAFAQATAATALAFLAIGAVRGRWVGRSAWRTAVETLAIGAVASGLAYVAGRALEPFV